MKAKLIVQERFMLYCKDGTVVSVFMDIYQLPSWEKVGFPDGFKISWIAFDDSDPSRRVLVDCHKPKSLHIHDDEYPEGRLINVNGLEELYAFFLSAWKKSLEGFLEDEYENIYVQV